MIPIKDDIPTRRFPILTVVIIALCTVIYFGVEHGGWQLGQKGNETVVQYGAVPYEISHPGKHVANPEFPDQKQAPTWVTLFTSMFLHGSFLHLAGNMLFLWVFGNNIEDSMGRPRFVLFYLLGGLAALFGQTLMDLDSTSPTVGASGAIAAVLGGYALLYPKARVVTLVFIIIFFTVIELPALLVLGLWFLIQVGYGATEVAQPVGGGGVAYFAHIGGFVFGLALIKLFANHVHEDYESQRRIPVY